MGRITKSILIGVLLCALAFFLMVALSLVQLSIVPTPTQPVNTWILVTALLSASGAVGGFAFHLVKNEGKLKLPVIETDAQLALGFGAEIIIGIAASNAIHIAISGIVTYGQQNAGESKFYLNFIALGILSGFAGATLLRALSDKLQQGLASKVETLEQNLGQTNEKTNLLFESRAMRILEDALLFRREPNQTDENLVQQIATEIQQEPESERTPQDWLILAYQADNEKKYSQAIQFLKRVNMDALPTSWKWVALNMRGLMEQYIGAEGWFRRAEDFYEQALAAATNDSASDVKENQILVTTVNQAYARLENQQSKESIQLFDKVLSSKNAQLSHPFAITQQFSRLGKSIALIRIAGPQEDSEKKKIFAEAAMLLNDCNFDAVQYLFEDKTVTRKDFDAMAALPNLSPACKEKLQILSASVVD